MARLGLVFGLICVLSLTAMITGCGSGGSSASKSGGGEETTASSSSYGAREETTTASAGPAGGILGTITVQETEFSLTPNQTTLNRPGRYVFRAENDGSVAHALAIENGEEGNEQGAEEGEGADGEEGEKEQSTRNLNPGETADLEVDLQPGTYRLYCPVDNHEERGMRATVTVQGG